MSAMEFWGVEVKSGEPIVANPGFDAIIHLSQACLGESKKDKGNAWVNLYVKVGDQKFVIGKLSGEKLPQTSFDIVFDKDFELSHDWKNGSVYFCGYKSYLELEAQSDHDDDDDSESELEEYPSEEGLPLVASAGNNDKEKSESQAKPAAENATASKSRSTAAKQKVKIAEPMKEDETSTEDDESDDDDSDAEDLVVTNGGGMSDDEEESGDDEDESEDDGSSDEDEETPKKKAEQSKKRPVESDTKSSAPEKKAKFVTPQKTDGKKGVVHVATPHPSKHASKASTSNDQAKQQNPSVSGTISCKACNRSFKSDQALQAHSKAKHGAAA